MTVTNVTPPTLSGTAKQGQTLQTTNGTWTYDLAYLTYAYQWLRCDTAGANCVDIGGATSASYLITGTDVGHTLRSEVTATEHAAATFDKYADPNGSDSNPGTEAQPYQTFKKLSDNLSAGQTGALRAGTYGTTTTYQKVEVGGTNGNPITITNFPGENVTIKGYIDIEANNFTLRGQSGTDTLVIDGANTGFHGVDPCGHQATQSLGVFADNFIMEYCEYFQTGYTTSGHSAIYTEGAANPTFRYNRVYNFGSCYAYDHGFYIGDGTTGCVITKNWIWNGTHGWGVQLYPNCDNAEVSLNVIDACGSGVVISDSGGGQTNNNSVHNNVISYSTGMTTQSGFFITGAGNTGSGPTGTGNTFNTNDCYFNPGGVGSQPNVSQTGNITVDPQFVDRANHNYAVQPGSPVAGWGLWDGT